MASYRNTNLFGFCEMVKSFTTVSVGLRVPSFNWDLMALLGSLDTMRQLKKDITEARKGVECGLGFEDYGDLEVGDLIQVYDRIEKAAVI